jgi:hypothetical protein
MARGPVERGYFPILAAEAAYRSCSSLDCARKRLLQENLVMDQLDETLQKIRGPAKSPVVDNAKVGDMTETDGKSDADQAKDEPSVPEIN